MARVIRRRYLGGAAATLGGVLAAACGEVEIRYVQGPPGPAGPAGAQGERGAAGAAGAKGAAGAAGQTIVVEKEKPVVVEKEVVKEVVVEKPVVVHEGGHRREAGPNGRPEEHHVRYRLGTVGSAGGGHQAGDGAVQ